MRSMSTGQGPLEMGTVEEMWKVSCSQAMTYMYLAESSSQLFYLRERIGASFTPDSKTSDVLNLCF